MAHGGDGHFHDLIRGLAELVLHVDGRRGEEDVDTRVARPVQRLPCAVDVVLVAAGERGDLHVGDGVGDGMNGFKVAHAGGRETGFDDVHAEAFQLTRHTELFLEVHGSAGGLLAIAELVSKIMTRLDMGFSLESFSRKQSVSVPTPPDATSLNYTVLLLFSVKKISYAEGRDRNRSNQVPFPPLDQSASTVNSA